MFQEYMEVFFFFFYLNFIFFFLEAQGNNFYYLTENLGAYSMGANTNGQRAGSGGNLPFSMQIIGGHIILDIVAGKSNVFAITAVGTFFCGASADGNINISTYNYV